MILVSTEALDVKPDGADKAEVDTLRKVQPCESGVVKAGVTVDFKSREMPSTRASEYGKFHRDVDLDVISDAHQLSWRDGENENGEVEHGTGEYTTEQTSRHIYPELHHPCGDIRLSYRNERSAFQASWFYLETQPLSEDSKNFTHRNCFRINRNGYKTIRGEVGHSSHWRDRK